MNIRPLATKDELAPLRHIYSFVTDTLAPIDQTSPAYHALLESIALSRLDLVSVALKKFVSANWNRIPLFSRGLLFHLADQLKAGHVRTLKTTTSSLNPPMARLPTRGEVPRDALLSLVCLDPT